MRWFKRSSKVEIRSDLINPRGAQNAMKGFERTIEQSLNAIRTKSSPDPVIPYSFLSSHYCQVAFYRYGLGYPFQEAIDHFRKSAEVTAQLYELRDSVGGREVTRREEVYNESTRKLEVTTKKAVDYSFFSPQKAVQGVFAALIGRAEDMIPRILRYVGHESDKDAHPQCSVRFAYALRDYFLSGNAASLAQIEEAERGGGEQPWQHYFSCLRALIDADGDQFSRAIEQLLKWHESETRKKINENDPRFYFSAPATAFCIMAQKVGIEVSIDSPLLPREFLQPEPAEE